MFASWLAEHPEAKGQSELVAATLHYAGPADLPFEAPHLTTQLLAQSSGATVIQATLDLRYQKMMERVLRAYVREQGVGIRNAAALLVDARDMGVVASMGSASFQDDSIAGQVNGALAKRSPGSALKPFIYALAIDQGLIHPLSILKDAPTAFGLLTAGEFRWPFRGPDQRDRRARALAERACGGAVGAACATGPVSVPAQRRNFAHGFGRHHGLALALGGGEVTMEEAAALYAMLPNDGRLRHCVTAWMSPPAPERVCFLSRRAS